MRKIGDVVDRTREAVVGDEVLLVSDHCVGGGGDVDGLAADFDGIFVDGSDIEVAVCKIQTGNRQAVDNDGEENEPVNNGNHGANQIRLLLITLSKFREKMTGMLHVKDSTSTNGTKVPHKQRFLPVCTYLAHELIGHEDGWDATEDDHQDTQAHQSTDGQAGLGIDELIKRHDGANVHETAEVEEDVHDRVDFVVAFFCFAEESPVPVQGVAGDETGQEVIGANEAADTEEPKLQEVSKDGMNRINEVGGLTPMAVG